VLNVLTGRGVVTKAQLHQQLLPVLVQNVPACHRRFRHWLARFNGVASRYLPNYLGWQWAVDGRRTGSAEGMQRVALGSSNMKR